MRALLLTILLLTVPAAAGAQPVPELLSRGFAAYETGGYAAALDAWLVGWGPDDVAPIRAGFEPLFQQVEAEAGHYMGSEFLGTVGWGEHARRVYALVLYEERPLFARFDLYQADGVWRVLNLTLNTDPERVFPPGLLVPPGFGTRTGG